MKDIKIKDLDSYSITNDYWSLIDSNKQLETVPMAIYSLQTFIRGPSGGPSTPILSANFYERMRSFRAHHCICFLIVVHLQLLTYIFSRTIQEGIKASELDLKTFLDHFVPPPCEAFAYAANQDDYEEFIQKKY